MKLVTSNENKLKEFKRLGLEELEIEKGRDLEEVDADSQTVIIYKALEAGEERIVEDTSLHVEGEDVGANVRWLLEDISRYNGKEAKWEVLLGENKGEFINVYQGLIEGTLTNRFENQNLGFGFDAYFIPKGEEKTLFELEEEGRKDEFSARKLAVENFKEQNRLIQKNKNSIAKWKGKMQH